MTDSEPTNISQNLYGFSKILNFGPDQTRRIFDDFPLGVIITDTLGMIVYYNKAHSEIDGISPEEMLGRRWIEALVPLNGPNIMYVCQRMAKPVLGYVYTYKTYKGRVVNASYWVYPIMGENGVLGSICFTQPLVSDHGSQSRAFSNPPLQWPGYIPLSDPAQNIAGRNPEFLKAVEIIKANSENSFSILISGESGSGRELLAKLCHHGSSRRGSPYLALNCESIPGNLLEGLLFGTSKGSFIGAISRPGMLTEATGGTLYLDELDSMPVDLQAKLKEALKEMKAARIGSPVKEKLDFKLLVSLGSDPHAAMESGKLDSELFAQIAVILVDIPPLRKRPEDIALLSEFFIGRYNKLLGKQALRIDSRLWELMNKYDWPGNVRELEQMLYGSIYQLSKDETVIGLKHLDDFYARAFSLAGEGEGSGPPEERGPEPPEASQALPRPFPSAGDASYLTKIQEEERKLKILLTENAGNVARAARKLGISRQLLNHRLKKYGINAKSYR
ncbi:MAG: sigma 54-interacting transcriptional regulator [Deltaproteobacteria bacterium]|jgi:arginine utilization regulatory protein|nr:sigma 54-interacting transcriptional regulator [Deltaproteobacteria bacterium]